jgi:S-methylmethionine-dependent homocysteine/selenocysteine methylase
MGTELQRRGHETGLPLWSAAPLITAPESVLEIHLDYLAAGADLLTTNTFRTTRRTFRRAHLRDRSAELTRKAVDLCHRARVQFPDREILIAGSMAPLEDCYRPDLVPPDDELHREHTEQAERLASAGVDFLLLETFNSTREAYAACAAATSTGKEVVVSFLCGSEATLYNGDPLIEAARALSPLQPAAFSVNCVPPPTALRSLKALRSCSPLPVAVYANVGLAGGEQQSEEFVRVVSEDEYAAAALRWLDGGASIIGGCCGTTPAYIGRLCEVLDQQAGAKDPF